MQHLFYEKKSTKGIATTKETVNVEEKVTSSVKGALSHGMLIWPCTKLSFKLKET